MKQLLIIWLLVLFTLLSGSLYMNHIINDMIEQLPEDNTSVVTGFNSLKVQNSDSTQLQPSQAVYEDETLPSMTVQPTMLDNELQHMKHYLFLQDTVPQMMLQPTYDASLAEDVTLVEPLIIYGTLDVSGLVKVQ